MHQSADYPTFSSKINRCKGYTKHNKRCRTRCKGLFCCEDHKPNYDICSICHEDIENKIYVLKCLHVFHPQCIKVWFNIRNSCPLCRKKFRQKN